MGRGKVGKSKFQEPDFSYKNPDAVFPQEAIVAYLDQDSGEGVSVAKLQDDVLEDTEEVRVSLLNQTDDNGDDFTYSRYNEAQIKVDKIIREMNFKIEKLKGRNAGQVYHIEKKILEEVKSNVTAQVEALRQQEQKEKEAQQQNSSRGAKSKNSKSVVQKEESEDDDEDEEEDQSEDEEERNESTVVVCFDGKAPREFKRVKGRKNMEFNSKKDEKTNKKKIMKKKVGFKLQENDEVGDMEEEKQEEAPKTKTQKIKKYDKDKSKGMFIEEQKSEEVNLNEDDEEEVPKKRRSSTKKEKDVSRVTKKKMVSKKKNKVTKKKVFGGDDEDDEEESEHEKGEEEELEDEDSKKKKKPKKVNKKPPKPKKLPEVYKKGKYNPRVKMIKHHDILMNLSDDIIDYGSVKANNRNLMRAVYTKNYPLLEKILKTNYSLSSLFDTWAPENSFTALGLAIRQKDNKAAKLILDSYYAGTLVYAFPEPTALQKVDTGNVSRAAFGVEIRKVNLMRGGREGNNAFTQESDERDLDFDSIFELPLSKELFDYWRLKGNVSELISYIHKLVLCGDRENASYLISIANNAGGYGFNNLHEEVLSKNNASELTPNIKKISVTKKPNGNSNMTPLHCAAVNPNADILDTLLQISPDYSLPDEKMRKLIHYAACCEGSGPLKLLLSKGVDAREKDQTGLTPMMYACYYGRAENVNVLLKDAKVDPLDKTKDGMMGIHWAAQRGHLEVLSVLIEAGVKLTLKGGKAKMTPLHFAAAYGHFECVEFLVANKAKVLVKDKLKRTPLSLAVRNGDLKIASYLLELGSDFEQADSSNNYPIHYAAAYGFPECVEILVKAGANVNVQNSWKLTPLTVAMLKNNFHCVQTLLSYPETDVNAKDDHGRSLLSLLVSNLSDENFKRISSLIKERNCDVNVADENGMAPLHYACQLDVNSLAFSRTNYRQATVQERRSLIRKAQDLKIQLIQLLLRFKADINAKTKKGEVPIQIAISNFDKELIDLFLDDTSIDLTFHDQNENNIYRLLYTKTLTLNRDLLERVLLRAGNIANILNEEKPEKKQQQAAHNSFGYNSYHSSNRYQHTKVSDTDPLNCNQSAFTCFKRTLMNYSLENYLNTEQRAVKEKKRKQLLEELEKQQEDDQAQQMQQGGLFGGGSYRSSNQRRIPEVDEIKLTKEEIMAYHEEAYKKFDKIVSDNLLLLEKFVLANGVLPSAEATLVREEYFNDPRFMIWTLDTFHPDLNIPNSDGNTSIFNLIYRRNKLKLTPSAKEYLIAYLYRLGNYPAPLEEYSEFRLFLELFSKFDANFNYKNTSGVAPILYLLRDRDMANAGYLEELIDYGANVNEAEDNNGSSPLFEAIYSNDNLILSKLISFKVNLNKKDKKGKAPLHYIADLNYENAKNIMKMMLEADGVEVDVKDESDARTPLHYAILKKNHDTVNSLLNAGADPNKTDRDWSNALFFASQVGVLSIMQAIGKSISDPNFSGLNGHAPIHHAVSNGKLEQVEYLLKIGANPNAKDHKGRTALMLAVIQEKLDIVNLLLKSGGSPNEKDIYERNCLHYAVNNSKPELMFQIEDALLRGGAQVNSIDMYGRTALHYAFLPIPDNSNFHNQNDPVECVTGLCIAENINLDVKDRRGRKPLHYAAEYGAYICILLMIKKKIALDEPDADGNTPLALALTSGHKDTAAILIQNNVNVTYKIHRINPVNFLWAHPKDPNYDLIEEEFVKENVENQKNTMEIENLEKESDPSLRYNGDITDSAEKNMIIEEKEKSDQDKMEEEEEDDVEDDATEDLEEEAKEREREALLLALPNEAKDDGEAPANSNQQKAPRFYTGQIQEPIDSFFAISIRKGWQGIAYLLLQNGFNLMEAIKDALNENQFRYVLALMTKIKDETLREFDHKKQNLFHIFATKGNKAPFDLTTRIFEGLILRGVDYKAQDSIGRTPFHYACEKGFTFLQDKLLEKKIDGNLLDNEGYNALHLSLIHGTFDLHFLEKCNKHQINLNTKFNWNKNEISPLHFIAQRNDQQLEKRMLRLGADPNIEDEQSLTPFQRVFIKNEFSLDRLKTYYDAKADFNKKFIVTYEHNKIKTKKTYTLLIYAVEKGWSYYEDQLLTFGVDASIQNNEGKTAFEYALAQKSNELTLQRLQLYVICGAPVKKPITCKIRGKKTKLTPVLYLLNLKTKQADPRILKNLLDSGVSINDTDSDGWTAVIYAIRRNSIPLLKLFLSSPNLDKNMKDKYGKTPIHHVVNPMDYASYENVEMLDLLAQYFDVNVPDNRGKTPIYYAYFQDSGTMKNALLRLGATEQKMGSQLQRQATSIIAGVDWPEEVDFEEDAEKYINEQEDKKMIDGTIEKIPPDEDAHNKHNLQVVYDKELGPYSLHMTKVDIGKGTYGEYLFYKMQVLHEKNRDNYILFTKWGRIGDSGMHQETPFPSEEECIKEFCKIFKDKSGNEWKNKASFQKVNKKYMLLNTSTRKNQRDYLQPIDWEDKNLPASKLDGPSKSIIKSIANVKTFNNYFGKHNVDKELIPFGKLSKELIFNAKKILLDLKEVVEGIEEIQKNKPYPTEEEEIKAMFDLKDKCMDLSSKFYELIPDTRFRLKPLEPIDDVSVLNEKVTLVNDMLDMEVSSKILLGAVYHIKEKNPLDYCFEALNIRLLPLTQKQREYKLITKYIKNGFSRYNPSSIVNIFALERRGEAERISQWKDLKNRTYLWHGSKLINFMGILSQGLRIAPPEAPVTGYMFGKGIYFADTFDKSYNYSDNYSYNDTTQSRLLLLCEVALGTSMECFGSNYVTKLDAPYKSVKGCGTRGPDPSQNEILANGAVVPLGKQIDYQYTDPSGGKIYAGLGYNEYIVYDISQVRMRYLIQVK